MILAEVFDVQRLRLGQALFDVGMASGAVLAFEVLVLQGEAKRSLMVAVTGRAPGLL